MRLDQRDDPLAVWEYTERYLGGGTRTYSQFSADLDISRRYHPQLGDPSFWLPTFRVPDSAGSYLPGSASKLHALYRGDDWLLLPVHPDTLADPHLPRRSELLACRPGPPMEVVPLANARTVLVRRIGDRPVEPHFLKLHYPRRLSRFTRRLRQEMIVLQLWVSRQLAAARVRFLPEVGGGVLGDDAQAWGYLLRERQLAGGSLQFTVPLFALYGQDLRAPDDPSLLEQLVARSGLPADEFLARRIVAPMVRMWWRIARRTGCLPEPHGQNTLVTFAADGQVRIGYRDCGVYVDPGLRAAAGLAGELPPRNVISADVRVPAGQVASLVYDTFLGHHTLSYLVALARDRLGVDEARLQRVARETFQRHAVPDLTWPKTTFCYDDRLRPDGAWQLADTGHPPHWR